MGMKQFPPPAIPKPHNPDNNDVLAYDLDIRKWVNKKVPGILVPEEITILAGQFGDISLGTFATYRSSRVAFTLENDTLDRGKSFLVSSVKVGGVLSDTISEKVGDPLNVSINVIQDGLNAIVRLTNNEAFTISVEAKTI